MNLSSNPIIRAENIFKHFSSGNEKIVVLQGIDLSILRGETISIRGESGCGKSTLLNILANLETADTGKLYWGEQDCTQLSAKKRTTQRAHFIGMIFQLCHLISELTVFENVLFAARMMGRVGQAGHQRARSLLERVGLGERLNSPPWHLSGGERQRVSVARALMNHPALILADEPTGNLDPVTGAEVMDLLFKVVQEEKASLVLVTHNPDFANQASRRFLLNQGILETVSLF